MRKIRINVVGTFADSDELNEIENVARVFLVERRMKALTNDIDKDKVLKNTKIKPSTKSFTRQNPDYGRLQYLNVRGLN